MTIKLNDGYDIPAPEEVAAEAARRAEAGHDRVTHFARMIAKAATNTLAQGVRRASLSRGFDGSRSYIRITEETVCMAARILMDAGYKIVWINGKERCELQSAWLHDTKFEPVSWPMNWETLCVSLPTKNESPGEGAST